MKCPVAPHADRHRTKMDSQSRISAMPVETVLIPLAGMHFSALLSGPIEGESVLLLHGFPQFADSWRGVMQILAQRGYRVIAFDQRGYSEQARPLEIEAYAIENLVQDVTGVADALGLTSFHLAGHDWGGLVAWQVAASQPERVLTLTSIATPHPQAFRNAIQHDAKQKWMSKYMLLFRAPGHLAEKLLLAADAWLLRRVYGGKVDPSQVRSNVQRLSDGTALTAALNWYRAIKPGKASGVRKAIAIPTLYVWGDADVALGEKAALETAAYVEGPYRFERVPGGSHWLLDEMPDQIADWMVQRMTGET